MMRIILISLIVGLIGSAAGDSDCSLEPDNFITKILKFFKNIFGNKWLKNVCVSFDSDEFQMMSHKGLFDKLDEELELNDKIIKINGDISKIIIIETKSGYYSIVCIKDKIYIQRTKKSEDVSKWKELTNQSRIVCIRKNPDVKIGASINYFLGELLQDRYFHISFNGQKFEQRSFVDLGVLDDVLIKYYSYSTGSNNILVIETQSGNYYSIEDRENEIYIQRSKNLQDVLKFGGESRTINQIENRSIQPLNMSLREFLQCIIDRLHEVNSLVRNLINLLNNKLEKYNIERNNLISIAQENNLHENTNNKIEHQQSPNNIHQQRNEF